MKTTRRILVVVICYLLSSYGILASLVLVGTSGVRSLSGALVGLVILLAWVCHLTMSVKWVIDQPSRKWVPVYGTAAGSLGLMLWPLAQPAIRHFAIPDVFHAAAMGVVLVFPCFLLAIHLVRFHLQRRSLRSPGAA